MTDVAVLLVVILVLVIVWRGPKTLPAIGRMLGRGVKTTKDEVRTWRDGDTPPDGTPPGNPPNA